MSWPWVRRKHFDQLEVDLRREGLTVIRQGLSIDTLRHRLNAVERATNTPNPAPGKWRVVVGPRGDAVMLSSEYDGYESGRELMSTNSDRWLDGYWQDEHVVVSGKHVTMAWRESV